MFRVGFQWIKVLCQGQCWCAVKGWVTCVLKEACSGCRREPLWSGAERWLGLMAYTTTLLKSYPASLVSASCGLAVSLCLCPLVPHMTYGLCVPPEYMRHILIIFHIRQLLLNSSFVFVCQSTY